MGLMKGIDLLPHAVPVLEYSALHRRITEGPPADNKGEIITGMLISANGKKTEMVRVLEKYSLDIRKRLTNTLTTKMIDTSSPQPPTDCLVISADAKVNTLACWPNAVTRSDISATRNRRDGKWRIQPIHLPRNRECDDGKRSPDTSLNDPPNPLRITE